MSTRPLEDKILKLCKYISNPSYFDVGILYYNYKVDLLKKNVYTYCKVL